MRPLALLVAVVVGGIAMCAPPSAKADALYDLRNCETGGQPYNYQLNTGNGFYGPYQFTLATWYGVGGVGLPSDASPEEQDYRAWLLLTQYGPQHWPVCQWRIE